MALDYMVAMHRNSYHNSSLYSTGVVSWWDRDSDFFGWMAHYFDGKIYREGEEDGDREIVFLWKGRASFFYSELFYQRYEIVVMDDSVSIVDTTGIEKAVKFTGYEATVAMDIWNKARADIEEVVL